MPLSSQKTKNTFSDKRGLIIKPIKWLISTIDTDKANNKQASFAFAAAFSHLKCICSRCFIKYRNRCNSVQTDPVIQFAILTHLQGWRNDQMPIYEPNFLTFTLLRHQSRMGWRHFFEGWISQEWTQATMIDNGIDQKNLGHSLGFRGTLQWHPPCLTQ
jgi:hypothetical protein